MRWLFRAALTAIILGLLPGLSALAAAVLSTMVECGPVTEGAPQCGLLGLDIGPVIAQMAIWGVAFLTIWPLAVLGLMLLLVWVALRAGPSRNRPR